MAIDGIKSWRERGLRLAPNERSGEELYLVTAPLGSSEWDIYTSGEVPRLGEAHPDNPGLVVRGFTLREGQGPLDWRAVITYARLSPEFPGSTPTDAPPRHRWLDQIETVEVDTDADGNPYSNSADEPFVPAPLKPIPTDVLEYEFNAPVSTVSLSWLRSYRYKVNADDQTGLWGSGDRKIGADIGEAIIESIRADYIEAQDTLPHYYRISLRILIRENLAVTSPDPEDNAWRRRLLDRGFRTKSGGGDYTTLVDENGLPFNQPQLLDGSGAVSSTPVFLWFRDFDSVNFDPLNIHLPAT